MAVKQLTLSQAEQKFVDDAEKCGYRLETIETGLGTRGLIRGFRSLVQCVRPNDWNPNRTDERTDESINESLSLYGQVLDCVCYVAVDGGLVLVDGEHRHEQLNREISITVLLGYSLPELKKLTAIFVETKGNPDPMALSSLLSGLVGDFGESLIKGLPYSNQRLTELLDMSEGVLDLDLDFGDDDGDLDLDLNLGNGDKGKVSDVRVFQLFFSPDEFKEVTGLLNKLTRSMDLTRSDIILKVLRETTGENNTTRKKSKLR